MEVTRFGNIINLGRHPYIASFTLEAARELGVKLIAASAQDGLAELAEEWTAQWGKPMKIIFGNGTEYISVGGETTEAWEYPLIQDALECV